MEKSSQYINTVAGYAVDVPQSDRIRPIRYVCAFGREHQHRDGKKRTSYGPWQLFYSVERVADFIQSLEPNNRNLFATIVSDDPSPPVCFFVDLDGAGAHSTEQWVDQCAALYFFLDEEFQALYNQRFPVDQVWTFDAATSIKCSKHLHCEHAVWHGMPHLKAFIARVRARIEAAHATGDARAACIYKPQPSTNSQQHHLLDDKTFTNLQEFRMPECCKTGKKHLRLEKAPDGADTTLSSQIRVAMIVPSEWNPTKLLTCLADEVKSGKHMSPRPPKERKQRDNPRLTLLAKQKRPERVIKLLPLLNSRRADDYEDWIKVMFVIHYEFDGNETGLREFHAFSSRSDKYDSDECDKKYSGVRGSGSYQLTFGSLLKWARKDNSDACIALELTWSKSAPSWQRMAAVYKRNYLADANRGKIILPSNSPDLHEYKVAKAAIDASSIDSLLEVQEETYASQCNDYWDDDDSTATSWNMDCGGDVIEEDADSTAAVSLSQEDNSDGHGNCGMSDTTELRSESEPESEARSRFCNNDVDESSQDTVDFTASSTTTNDQGTESSREQLLRAKLNACQLPFCTPTAQQPVLRVTEVEPDHVKIQVRRSDLDQPELANWAPIDLDGALSDSDSVEVQLHPRLWRMAMDADDLFAHEGTLPSSVSNLLFDPSTVTSIQARPHYVLESADFMQATTDVERARMFARFHDQDLVLQAGEGKDVQWYVYAGPNWQLDANGHLVCRLIHTFGQYQLEKTHKRLLHLKTSLLSEWIECSDIERRQRFLVHLHEVTEDGRLWTLHASLGGSDTSQLQQTGAERKFKAPLTVHDMVGVQPSCGKRELETRYHQHVAQLNAEKKVAVDNVDDQGQANADAKLNDLRAEYQKYKGGPDEYVKQLKAQKRESKQSNDESADSEVDPVELLNNRLQRINSLRKCWMDVKGFKSILDALKTLVQTSCKIEWDVAPYKLAFRNGVVDMRTNKLGPGNPKDYFLNVCKYAYDENVDTAEWHGIVTQITSAPQVAVFLQTFFGMQASGVLFHPYLLILFGAMANNGKTLLCEGLLQSLRPFAITGSIDVLLDTKHGSAAGAATPHLSQLKGRRIVITDETPRNARFNEQNVQSLTGGGTTHARALYKNEEEFASTAAFNVATNYFINFDGSSRAMIKRLRVLPFNRVFKPNPDPRKSHEIKENPHLKEQIRRGEFNTQIAKWLVQGFQLFLKNGLKSPVLVDEATRNWWEQAATKSFKDGDKIRRFELHLMLKGGKWQVDAPLENVYHWYADFLVKHDPLAGFFSKPIPAADLSQQEFQRVWATSPLVLRLETRGRDKACQCVFRTMADARVQFKESYPALAGLVDAHASDEDDMPSLCTASASDTKTSTVPFTSASVPAASYKSDGDSVMFVLPPAQSGMRLPSETAVRLPATEALSTAQLTAWSAKVHKHLVLPSTSATATATKTLDAHEATLHKRLARVGLRVRNEKLIRDDGNCMYDSLADQLVLQDKAYDDAMWQADAGLRQAHSDSVRAAINNYVNGHPHLKNSMTVQERAELPQDKAWGHHVALLSATEIWTRRIEVFSDTQPVNAPPLIIEPCSEQAKQRASRNKSLHLVHWFEQHYGSAA